MKRIIKKPMEVFKTIVEAVKESWCLLKNGGPEIDSEKKEDSIIPKPTTNIVPFKKEKERYK
jgi:hypothetical protein